MANAPLNPLQADVLREVANVGAGHAATALAQLAGAKISIDVPRIWVAPIREILDRNAPDGGQMIAVSMRVLGDLTGQILFVMPMSGAHALLEILLRRKPSAGELGAMERSGLQETGNILASSFLNALARWLGKILLPSVPTVTVDSSEGVNRTLAGAPEPVIAVETAFLLGEATGDRRLTGTFVFLLDERSLETVLRELRVG